MTSVDEVARKEHLFQQSCELGDALIAMINNTDFADRARRRRIHLLLDRNFARMMRRHQALARSRAQ